MKPARIWQRDAALVAAAAFELASRQKHYPGMIERDELPRQTALEDIAAWRAIAELFDRGRVDHDLSWADLMIALDRAMANRRDACAENPADDRLAARMTAVQTIADQVGRSARHARGAA